MHKRTFLAALVVAAGITAAHAQPQGGSGLPDGPGKEVVQRVCGATCHGAETMMGTGRSREGWTGIVNSMIARGAKATDAETVQIAEYLSSHFGPNYSPPVPPTAPPASAPRRNGLAPSTGAAPKRGPGPLGAGAADSHVVDAAGADRGRGVYIAECITCHGPKATGGDSALPPRQRGPDLVRSLVVLHDRYGSEIGPFLTKGHPLQSGKPASTLSKEQIGDLAHFLHQKVYYTLRGGPDLKIQNILTGDAKAGQTYFNGEGKCSSCHSPTGDFAGIGKRYDLPTLQTKFLFPRTVGFARGGSKAPTAKEVTVTVTQPNGQVVEGVLDKLDDFNVSLRDSRGEYHAFAISPALKVVKHDPYAVHVEMLDKYTDKNIHDVVAYMESLK